MRNNHRKFLYLTQIDLSVYIEFHNKDKAKIKQKTQLYFILHSRLLNTNHSIAYKV